MSMTVLVLIGILVLVVLLASGIPVALALASAGVIGIILSSGADVANSSQGALPYEAVAVVSLVVIPMFVLMGTLAEKARVAEDVYGLASRLMRGLPGGLGLATVAACATFGAVSGSSVAAAATFGRVSIREMLRHGYSAPFAAGLVAISGTLSVMIPPSIVLVVYGIITGESIGKLLIAGIVPGILSAVMLMIGVLVLVRFGPADTRMTRTRTTELQRVQGNNGEVGATSHATVTTRGWAGLGKVVVLFAIVVGGIYGGFLTASEAAGVGAAAALVMLLADVFRYGVKSVTKRVIEALTETAATSSFIFAILIGATIFTYFLVSIGVPDAFAAWTVSLPVPGLVIVAVLLLALIPLGMFLDPMSILLIVVPLAYPVVTSLGFNGIWFGILMVQFIEIGLVTPPVGLNVFVVANTPGVGLGPAFKGVFYLLPFEILTVIIVFSFPDMVTWLPNLM